jgi:membrane-associated phospholipid phosphatase
VSRPRSIAGVACLVAYAAFLLIVPGRPGRRERLIFERINAGEARPWLRIPQQWGTPWTLPVVALVAAARRRPRIALATLACVPVEKAAEVATKNVLGRPRPVFVQPTVLRDDAPVDGGSMPSGHAAIAACGAVAMVGLVPAPVAACFVALAGLSAWIRVRQGAHEPMDAVGGLLLGSGVGLLVTGVTGSSGPRTAGAALSVR